MSKLREHGPNGVMFRCPGCSSHHALIVRGPGAWGWSSSNTAPTFTPSVLATYSGPDAGIDGAPPARCHSFVADGRIQFLTDCTHAPAGQTVDLPDWEMGQ